MKNTSPLKSHCTESTVVRSLLTLAGGAAVLPLAVSPADAAIIVDSSYSGSVIGWDIDNGQMRTALLSLPGANITIGTRADSGGYASYYGFVGVVAAGANFRRDNSTVGLNPVFLAPSGATASAGAGVYTFANINLGVFSTAGNFGNAAFSGPPSRYLLFSFANNITSQTNYGWIELTATTIGFSGGKSNYSATLGTWAYDNSGAKITAGAIPEPSSMSLAAGALVLGAAGLRRWRKNRSASLPTQDGQA